MVLDDPRLPFITSGCMDFNRFFQHYGALDAIIGHIPYLSGLFGFVGFCKQILAEMSSHILIFGGFITSLLNGIHVILRHIPYSSGSPSVCPYNLYREDESCYDILGISSCFDKFHTEAYPPSFRIIWRWLVCACNSYRGYESLL